MFKWGLLDNIENALSFIKKHTNTEYVITGKPRREEIHDYPESALREAVINAVCHRDYFTEEVPVSVEVFEDRVQIRNPGGLPKGYDPKRFGTESIPRNLLIASMLHRVDYIEKAGTGISRIKEAIKNHKRKVKLKIEYGDNSLFYRITFKKVGLAKTNKRLVEKQKKHKEAYNKDKLLFKINESEFQSIFGVNINEFRSIFGVNILNTAWLIYKNHDITAQEIAEKLSITKRSAENYFSKLKTAQYIKRIGSDKTGHWKIIKKK
ncbi:MAG: HTH domain-containing protein [Oligoflexia bacterium]|nr:HTH domain-containing protein [Oligoflexia bacterium]